MWELKNQFLILKDTYITVLHMLITALKQFDAADIYCNII